MAVWQGVLRAGGGAPGASGARGDGSLPRDPRRHAPAPGKVGGFCFSILCFFKERQVSSVFLFLFCFSFFLLLFLFPFFFLGVGFLGPRGADGGSGGMDGGNHESGFCLGGSVGSPKPWNGSKPHSAGWILRPSFSSAANAWFFLLGGGAGGLDGLWTLPGVQWNSWGASNHSEFFVGWGRIWDRPQRGGFQVVFGQGHRDWHGGHIMGTLSYSVLQQQRANKSNSLIEGGFNISGAGALWTLRTWGRGCGIGTGSVPRAHLCFVLYFWRACLLAC